MRILTINLLLGLTLLLSACGNAATNSQGSTAVSDSTQTAHSVSDTQSTAVRKAKKSGPQLKVSKSRYGKILTDRRGFTLYLFTADKGKGKSKCYGDCAKAWPPYLSKEPVTAGKGVEQDLIGLTSRKGQSISQVTYRGHPLYYYQGEHNPYEIFCQAVEEFGGFWYVVSPSGKAIRKS